MANHNRYGILVTEKLFEAITMNRKFELQYDRELNGINNERSPKNSYHTNGNVNIADKEK